jgi:signal transduction histidine kinase
LSGTITHEWESADKKRIGLTGETMKNPFTNLLRKTRSRNQIYIVAAYRFAALLVEAVLSAVLVSSGYYRISPFILFMIAIVEAIFMSVLPFFLTRKIYKYAVFSLLIIDILVCVFLIMFSGATSSPFVLYSLAPVLTAALIFGKKTTAILSAFVMIAVIISHIFNPYYPYAHQTDFMSHISIYIAAICLVAILPFVVNANLRQNLERENIKQERQRLSREIHDGVAQTLYALTWQAQQVRHRLVQANADGEDIQKLEQLATKARRDIVESLEVLRNFESQGNFVSLLREKLQNLKQESGIEYTLKIPPIDFKLDGKTEFEILRVFQEALINIKKHAEAKNINVSLKHEDGNVELNITDDGRGFDSRQYYENGEKIKGHHGLGVMRDRVISLNGQFRISSSVGKGTIINIVIPTVLDSHGG